MKMKLPRVIFGTSGLGNLFIARQEEVKLKTVEACLRHSLGRPVFDSAGKYGAGLALEVLGRSLRRLGVSPADVVISNKLGWVRSPLLGDEPTFEPGVWKELQHDAIQKISYDGILECYDQGNELLGGYTPQMVSVHDPDEYLAGGDPSLAGKRYRDILGAYEALFDLKRRGRVSGVGVGAKDWRVIQRIVKDVPLDWVMFAGSMTIRSHPEELMGLMKELSEAGVAVINSAVFNSGFLVGSDYYDYRKVSRDEAEGAALYRWREEFFAICDEYGVKPAAACVQFALRVPGVSSVALHSSEPGRVGENQALVETVLPDSFWREMKKRKLIDREPDHGVLIFK